MKKLILILLPLLFSLSCSKDGLENKRLFDMSKSFKVYIKNNDLEKNMTTNLIEVKTISYEKLTQQEDTTKNEVYKAKVFMEGTTSLIGSSRIYNLQDTVTCYFDENLKMLRLVNPNDQ